MPAARREGPEPVLEIEGRRARSEQAICSEHSQPPSMGAPRGWVQGADRPPPRQLPSAWGRLRGWAGSGWAAWRLAPGSGAAWESVRWSSCRAARPNSPQPSPRGSQDDLVGITLLARLPPENNGCARDRDEPTGRASVASVSDRFCPEIPRSRQDPWLLGLLVSAKFAGLRRNRLWGDCLNALSRPEQRSAGCLSSR